MTESRDERVSEYAHRSPRELADLLVETEDILTATEARMCPACKDRERRRLFARVRKGARLIAEDRARARDKP